MDDETGESPNFKKRLIFKIVNCTRLTGLSNFFVIEKNVFVLFSSNCTRNYFIKIFSKLSKITEVSHLSRKLISKD